MQESQSKNERGNWRVFCAVELPAEVRERIRSHIVRLKTALPEANASWTRPESTHLTLKFFGNVEQSRIPEISGAAERTVRDFHPCQIVISGTGVFPNVSRPRVLWIGVSDPDSRLGELQSRFEFECAKEGFPKEERKFRPHLTIARFRRPEGVRGLVEAHTNSRFEEVMVDVNELIVFRSEPGSAGSKYTALSRHSLRTVQL
jgi:2'-5' RNA ligase